MGSMKVGVTDSIRASIETVPKQPLFPCEKCGSETLNNGKVTLSDGGKSICTHPKCRLVQERPKLVERDGPLDERPWRPCVRCKRETLPIGRKRVRNNERICARADCRHVSKG